MKEGSRSIAYLGIYCTGRRIRGIIMPVVVVEHKKCICVEFGDTNNNKVWQYTLFDDGTALTEWGRVGKKLQSKTVAHTAALQKWREKTNQSNKPDKRYTEVKAVGSGSTQSGSSVKKAELKEIARKQIKFSNPIVQKLVDFCVDANAHQIMQQSGGKIQYDTSTAQFTTPLGVIDPEQVADARTLLVQISDFVRNSEFNSKKFDSSLNSYLRLIPHDVGMKKITPQGIFPNIQSVSIENDLLDGLEASFAGMIAASDTSNKKTTTDAPKVFEVDLELVTDKKIISDTRKLFQKTIRRNHITNDYSIVNIYQVDIATVKSAFDKKGAKRGNIMRLWHGTKASNLLSIMRQGLVIPPSGAAHCTGRMYGNGVYASSISTKALNYATSFWGSGGRTDRTFMFLVDFAMGKTHIAGSGWSSRYPVSGSDSTWAKGGQSGVINDEMIVYDTDQVNLIYLCEFGPRR
jgi:poly [ADP-ribose] polymerase 2/3/4